MLRNYPVDSPQAAARLLALTALADDQLDRPGLARLEALGAPQSLGLGGAEWRHVLAELHEDLPGLADAQAAVNALDPMTLHSLLAEVCRPQLREQVLSWCLTAAEADARITHGEALVLEAVVEHWGLQARMFERRPSAMLATAC
jgi:hypothetical protein